MTKLTIYLFTLAAITLVPLTSADAQWGVLDNTPFEPVTHGMGDFVRNTPFEPVTHGIRIRPQGTSHLPVDPEIRYQVDIKNIRFNEAVEFTVNGEYQRLEPGTGRLFVGSCANGRPEIVFRSASRPNPITQTLNNGGAYTFTWTQVYGQQMLGVEQLW